MERRTPPPTAHGWYVLHDFRTVSWDDWRAADETEREAVLDSATSLLESLEKVDDADEGVSAFFVGLGHECDFIGIHFRPSLADLDLIERRIESNEFGSITDRSDSYISVTEVSGYLSSEYFDEEKEVDPGVKRYIETRLHPSIPDVDVMSFYPMSKRRDPEDNWYDLPLDERASHIESHGDIGKNYAGRVNQVITGSIGFESWEWGVTLFADEMITIKELLTEMRFDPSTSRYAEFGPFHIGRRLRAADLDQLFEGQPIGVKEASEVRGGATQDDESKAVRSALEIAGIHAGETRGDNIQALVLYSKAEGSELQQAVDSLAGNFDRYDTHVDTGVYETADRYAVVSLWKTADAAETAAGFLADLPGIQSDVGDGWETMGMFYTVKPQHRDSFVQTFDAVESSLKELDGHRETDLFVRVDDDCDMFISSRWDTKENALAFFASDDFRETVQWGRDVLERRPRHVVLSQ